MNLTQQIEMFKQQYSQIYNEYKRLMDESFYKRMEFSFKVLDNSGFFSPEFVLKIQQEIEIAMSDPTKEGEKTEE